MEKDIKRISLKAFTYLFGESEKCNRRFCFILGSGASREAGIPTGVEMAKVWVNDLEKKYEKKELSELMEELNIVDIEPNSKNYFGIYELLFYPDYRDGHAYFERELEKGSPSLGHHAIAKILAGKIHNLAITTNFDSLLEDALFIYTNKRPLVVGHESLTEFINLNIDRPIIAKIHRSLYFQPFNRQQELDGLAKGWQETLKNAFMIYTPIVIGYAGGDHSLMKFLQDESIKMHGLYWCYWNKEEPSEEIKELVKSKKGCLVPIEGFDQMMFMLSRKLAFEKPEAEMTKVTQMRIDQYNLQYDEFEKKIRHEATKKELPDEAIHETLREIETFYDIQLKQAEMKSEREQTAESYNEKGLIYSRMSKHAEAIADFTKAIKLEPEYGEAYNNRGYSYNKLEEYEKAITDFTKAIKFKSRYAEAYTNRGSVYKSLEQYEKAIEDLTQAIEFKPTLAVAYNNRGYIYSILQEYDKAIADFKKTIELRPDVANPYMHIGKAYYEQKTYLESMDWLNQAIERNPKYKEAFELRANVYRVLGYPEKALEDEEAARDMNND